MKDCRDSRRNRFNNYFSGVGAVTVTTVPEVTPIRSKEEQGNIPVLPEAAQAHTPKKMIKKIEKIVH